MLWNFEDGVVNVVHCAFFWGVGGGMMITSSMMGNTESETEQRNDDSCCGIMVCYDCRILEKLTPYSKLLVCKLQVLQVQRYIIIEHAQKWPSLEWGLIKMAHPKLGNGDSMHNSFCWAPRTGSIYSYDLKCSSSCNSALPGTLQKTFKFKWLLWINKNLKKKLSENTSYFGIG